MASPRKSAVQIRARELARERAAAYLRRQDTLLELAEGFYAKQAELDALAEKEAARLEAIRLETARESVGIAQDMANAVAAMVATGEPVSAVAERLGLKPKDVRSMAEAATASKPAQEPGDSVAAAPGDAPVTDSWRPESLEDGDQEHGNGEQIVLRESVPVG